MQHPKIKVFAGFIFLFVLTVPLIALAATPQISSIGGDMTNGSVVTVFGSNFMSEDKTNWISFFQNHPNASSFEGAIPADDGYGAAGQTGGVYDTSVKLLGNQSMRFNVSGAYPAGAGGLTSYNAIGSGGGDSQDLWLRFYASWNSANNLWASDHIKMVDCQGSAAGQYYFQTAAGTSLPSNMAGGWDSATHNAPIPSGTIQNGRWYCFEVHWKSTAPYSYQAWMDGVQIFNATPSTPGSLTYILMGIINASGTSSAFSLAHWWDGFAVSTSRVYPASTIQIGNSPTYGQGSEKWQEPVALDESSVQFKMNVSGLGSGPYYLWITNNTQATNAPYAMQAGSPSANVNVNASAAGNPGAGASAGGGGGGGGGGGCFIATAAFGSYQEGHVRILRQFRDTFLLTNTAGKAFVEWYYRHSPKYAVIIAGRPALRAIARTALLPLYAVAFLSLNGFLAPLILVILCAVLSYLFRRN